MKKINLFNFTSVKGFNLNHNLRALLVMLLFALGTGNVWGFTSTPKFSIAKTSDTPNGAGMIYGYRGGGDATTSGDALYLEGDKLKTGITGWVAAETGMNLAEMTIKQTGGSTDSYNPSTDAGNRPDGYKVLDRATDNGDNTVHILHMYYYAKPNPGYEYVGWYSDATGTTAIAGSTDHYPYPQTAAAAPKKKSSKTYTPTRWDNGDGSKLPAKGPYSDFYYLRDAQEITKATAEAAKTVYVKFRIIPRHVVFVGTGFDDVTYTAGGTNVGANNVESGNITGNIDLNITYDADKYNFNGWQWSLGSDGAKTDISTSASATYTFVVDRGYPTATYNSTTGGYDYGAYTKVYIQPLLTEKVDYVAEVTYNEVTTSYATWDAAFAAAKATGVSGAVITLKKDVADITTEQTVDRNMTLNLNGHTLTGGGTNSYLFTVSGSGTVFTLCDNTPVAAGRIVYNTSEVQYPYAIGVKTGAKLQIASGGVSATSTKSDGSSRGVEIQAGGTLEMTGGEIYSQSINSAYALLNRGTATIGGGNIRARAKGTSTSGTGKTAVAFYSVGTSGTINGGTFTATADSTTSYGIQHNVASNTLTINNATVTATAGKSGAVALQRNNGKILVKDGKYKATSVLNTTNKSYIELQGGIYSTWTNVRQSCTTGYDCYELQPGVDWNDGYRFEVIAATANPRVCKILEVGKSTSYYTSLSDALAYANNNTGSVMSIIMIAFEHTLPAGNYTLPQRADLVVPYSVDQTGVVGASPVRVASNSTPSAFRKLTLASGVNIDAFGKIEAGGRQSLSGTGATGAGIPSGAYGWLVLQNGSKITLESGSQLSAWGFVTGQGEIDARRGSIVYEQFQMYGWMGGSNASGMYSKTFPITQYFVQNVEAPVKYHPGARLITATGVYVSSTMVTTDAVNVIGVDGDVAMFLMANEDDSEDTWVRKRYDVETDRQVYEINSSARLGSLRITLEGLPLIGTLDMDSRNYTLPITNNMKIHLLTGEMGITQSTMMLAGTQIEVDKEATANIASGQSLYLYDDAEWGQYAFQNALAHRIKYRPEATPTAAKRDISSAEALGDAKLFVHGTFDVKGSLYTTSTGSNIYSTNEDAGTIKFTTKAASSNSSMTMYSGDGTATTNVTAVPALLRNGDNSTTATSGTAAGKSFAYSAGKWQCWTQEGCFFVDNTDTYYAKPADYVALLNGKIENADHTYTSADETRTFILVEGCQWWEVELEDADAGLWHCTHPLNDVYYYHNGTSWVVKKQTVTWKNYDGSVVATYTNVPYKTTPVFNSTTPTRPMDDYYTYDFKEWSPVLAPITTDMVYTAQYTPKDRKYTIVFKNEDGSVIETNYCTMGQVPVCSKEPSKEGYNLVWSPTIQAVTGDAEYQATFTNVVAASYLITFKNYNNTETLQSGQVTTGTMPVYNGATPTKPSTADQQFTWTGWEPALHDVDADAIYTPTFSASPITYTIKWQVNGVITKQETVNKGVTPSYGSIPTKEAEEHYSYNFTGWSPAVAPASSDQTYVAQFSSVPNKYALTVQANNNAYGTVSGGGTYDYNTAHEITATPNAGYKFVEWNDHNTSNPRSITITGAATYTAIFAVNIANYTVKHWKQNLNDNNYTEVTGDQQVLSGTIGAATAAVAKSYTGFAAQPFSQGTIAANASTVVNIYYNRNTYTITWVDDNEDPIETDINVKYGATPSYDGETPTKPMTDQYEFEFSHWTPNVTTVTGDETYKATFNDITRQYTITWEDADGSALEPPTTSVQYGVSPTHSAPSHDNCTFTGWKAASNGTIYAGILPMVGTNNVFEETYTAQFECTLPPIVVDPNEKNTVVNNTTTTTTTVHVRGTLVVEDEVTLTTNNLILEASAEASGEIVTTGAIEANNIYFDLILNNPTNRRWNAFTVPFRVDLRKSGKPAIINGEPLTLGRGYDIVYYDGSVRAERGPVAACWKYVEDEDSTLIPGRAYMIVSVSRALQTVRFTAADVNTAFDQETVHVNQNASTTGRTADRGWNGIGNPTMYHTMMDAGVTECQVHDGGPIGADGYHMYVMTDKKFVVGKAVYVQVDNGKDVDVEQAGNETVVIPAHAPRRTRAEINAERFDVNIAPVDAEVADHIFVLYEENKADEYVILSDLAKAGVSSVRAQMWVDRYGEKLCKNTTALIKNKADYPLGIYAPQSGEYEIFLNGQATENANLYLTYDGKVIWNLNYGGYTASLEAGTNTRYGLRLVRTTTAVVTGIEEMTIENGDAIRKVVVDDKVYIIRNGEIYSVTGQKVQ